MSIPRRLVCGLATNGEDVFNFLLFGLGALVPRSLYNEDGLGRISIYLAEGDHRPGEAARGISEAPPVAHILFGNLASLEVVGAHIDRLRRKMRARTCDECGEWMGAPTDLCAGCGTGQSERMRTGA